jgi:hypothetical protein
MIISDKQIMQLMTFAQINEWIIVFNVNEPAEIRMKIASVLRDITEQQSEELRIIE